MTPRARLNFQSRRKSRLSSSPCHLPRSFGWFSTEITLWFICSLGLEGFFLLFLLEFREITFFWKNGKSIVFGFREVLIDDKVSEATYDSKGMEDRMEIVTWFVHGEKRSLFQKFLNPPVLSYPWLIRNTNCARDIISPRLKVGQTIPAVLRLSVSRGKSKRREERRALMNPGGGVRKRGSPPWHLREARLRGCDRKRIKGFSTEL